MIVLLDTNISLDFLLKREPFFEPASRILEMVKDDKIKACITASSVTDIYYIMRRYKSQEERVLMLSEYLKLVEIISTTKTDIIKALKMKNTDFEDAVMFQSGKRRKVDYIVTRDRIEFSDKTVKIVTPEEFLRIVRK